MCYNINNVFLLTHLQLQHDTCEIIANMFVDDLIK